MNAAALEMKELITKCVKALCDFPLEADVQVVSPGEKSICLFINCHKNDVPKLVGKGGNNIRAMKTLINAISGKHRVKASLMINE